jgi:endonuclease/exonuclease/phosphatase family metal-dependent hydrolase
MSPPPSEVTVASFNLHAGIDGWGRTFDVAAACRDIDADVLVLQEVWKPAGLPSMATEIASELGYSMAWRTMAEGRRGRPHPRASESWMRIGDYRSESNSLFLDSERPVSRRVRASVRYQEAEPGAWGLAVLSRLPVTKERVVDLGRLPVDRAMRAAVLLDVDVGGRTLVAGGTHMSHLTSGSPLQYLRLRHRLERMVGQAPAVLAGDMNLWGPPTEILLHGWRRAVIGRTWPAWRPHSQVDHILVRGPVTVREASVLPDFGSDHRAVRVRLGGALG